MTQLLLNIWSAAWGVPFLLSGLVASWFMQLALWFHAIRTYWEGEDDDEE